MTPGQARGDVEPPVVAAAVPPHSASAAAVATPAILAVRQLVPIGSSSCCLLGCGAQNGDRRQPGISGEGSPADDGTSEPGYRGAGVLVIGRPVRACAAGERRVTGQAMFLRYP